ncbi:MAG: hypothetical protein M1829_005202 [Trizodia sp. TS-e1964]|nr:MAG: hypothetical protein M1829_005202 [Trizodia sp. TS-e1964]
MDTQESADITQSIMEQVARLQIQIEEGKAEIEALRALANERRFALSSANKDLPARRSEMLESVERSIRHINTKWNSQHSKTVEARIFLCREAASLYGLRQRRRRKGGNIREDYVIGGLGIVDLRDLNRYSHGQITASLDLVAHLLMLISHYLGLKLPAEITLPHRNYPLATIFSPSASYLSRDVPFPGSGTPHPPSSSSNTAQDSDRAHRPRPLFLSKSLTALAKEDAATYNYFIEGVTLLAWDVAWVCKTQGIAVNNWEDLCAFGRNLWLLLVAPPPTVQMPSSRTPSPQVALGNITNDLASPLANNKGNLPSLFGQFSHGTSHSFLGGFETQDFMKGWKLNGPIKAIDKVKSALQSEMAGAEWEVLEEKEWGEELDRKEEEEAVFVKGGRRKSESTVDEMEADQLMDDELVRKEGEWKVRSGTNGWTKLKSR